MRDSEPTHADKDEPERLLERYLAGDMTAFEILVELYQDRLYWFIERLTGDPHLAEDVFQSVFLKVANKAGDFDRRASFSTWLFRIARNCAIDEMRKQRRHLQFVDPGLEEWLGRRKIDAQPTPLERTEGGELQCLVRALLADIPAVQREAFLLKEEADLGFREIANVLGCGKETAKSRFRLAVEKLREGLTRMGWNPAGKRGGDA
ncbi:MAG: sigma-70 family RNA polymerase sigma factor [Planctomycetota bacterium]|jgi:RNA polymerase sigma-70 factor (ECF subfamily)|nr:sigma-70 family RNA polymerase sigma factor [Planctomycetota bacterium]